MLSHVDQGIIATNGEAKGQGVRQWSFKMYIDAETAKAEA